jgi:sigma-E factor negative regulatory protein RseC
LLDQGRVVKIEGKLALVEFSSSSACAGCGACHKAKSGQMATEAFNDAGAKVGEMVEVEVSRAVVTLFPFIAYMVPGLFFFVGVILGTRFSEVWGIVAGFILLVIGILAARSLGQYIGRQKRFICRIVRTLA